MERLRRREVLAAAEDARRHVDHALFEDMVAYVGDLLAPFEAEHELRGRLGRDNTHLLGTSGTVTTVAGVHLGLPRTTATELVVQTVVGSAKLLRETGEHPTVLREQVTSPGGTTAAAVRELEDHKVRAAFLTAMEAARNRSRALAEEAQ